MESTAELEARLARVETTLDRLVTLMERQATPFSEPVGRAEQALSNIYGADEMNERVGELVLRLGEPETLDALTRIGILLPRIEYALQFAAGGPELLEEGLEMVREKMHEAGTDAADAQRRAQKGLEAADVLSRPAQLDAVQTLGHALPALAPLADAAARTGAQLAAYEGKEAFTGRLAESLLRIAEPETLDALTRVATMVPQIEYAVTALTAGPEVLEEGLQMVREAATEKGIEPTAVDARARAAIDAAAALSDPKVLNGLVELSQAVLEPDIRMALEKLVRLTPNLERTLAALPVQDRTLDVLRTLNAAVEDAAGQKRSVGMFGALGALGDDRVKRALGFALTVAERLGETLEREAGRPALGDGRRD